MVTPTDLAEENEKKILHSLLDGPKRWKNLKEETKLSDRTLAKRLKSLIRKGMITEEIDEKDRRVKIYKITEKGVKASTQFRVSIGLALKIGKLFDPTLIKTHDDFLKIFSYILGFLTFTSVYRNGPYWEVLKKALDSFKELIHDEEYQEIIIKNDPVLKKKIETYIEQELPVVLSYLVPTPKEKIKEIEEKMFGDLPQQIKVHVLDRLILDFFESQLQDHD